MKRALFALFASALLIGSYTTPSFAGETASGRQFNVQIVDGFPGTCPTGETMRGTIVVDLIDKGTPGSRKPVILVQTRVETAFGDVVLSQQTIRVSPGSSTEIPVEVAVPNDVPAGSYTFDFDVKVGVDTATVDQTVGIY